MRTVEQVIADSIRYDYRTTTNVQRIITNLHAEGFTITRPARLTGRSTGRLPETARVYITRDDQYVGD